MKGLKYLSDKNASRTQTRGIEIFFTIYFGQRILKHFGLKNQAKKVVNIPKDFELYQVIKNNFLCQNVLKFSIYILFTKRIETLWSRNISSKRDIRTF